MLDRIIKLEFNGFKIEKEFVYYQVLSSATELFLKRLSKIRRVIFNCESKVQGYLQHKWILLLFKKLRREVYHALQNEIRELRLIHFKERLALRVLCCQYGTNFTISSTFSI